MPRFDASPEFRLRSPPVKYQRREMGSKYFGRAIKKWRLIAGLSQEELAKRAQVSVTLVGTVERERGHLSEEIFCKLCLGLESKLDRPILRPVFSDGIASLWQELSVTEGRLRKERGLETGERESPDLRQEDLEQSIDSAFAEMKKFILLLSRSLDSRSRGQEWLPGDLLHEQPGGKTAAGKVRVRNPGGRRKAGSTAGEA